VSTYSFRPRLVKLKGRSRTPEFWDCDKGNRLKLTHSLSACPLQRPARGSCFSVERFIGNLAPKVLVKKLSFELLHDDVCARLVQCLVETEGRRQCPQWIAMSIVVDRHDKHISQPDCLRLSFNKALHQRAQTSSCKSSEAELLDQDLRADCNEPLH